MFVPEQFIFEHHTRSENGSSNSSSDSINNSGIAGIGKERMKIRE